MKADENLRQYATEKQWEALEAIAEHGSMRAAARALGINYSAVYSQKAAVIAKAVRHGYSPDHDMVHPLPDGLSLKGTSTLYDPKTGEPKLQWVKSQVDKERQHEIFMAMVDELGKSIPRATLPAFGMEHASDQLMACYPLGDHHVGMLSWGIETGASYDLKISEDLLHRASEYLIASSPACEEAAVVVLGDFMHYDSFEPVTPTSRNQLDVDSRFPKMVRAAIRMIRHMIETAAQKHKHVRVIIEIGNHDLSSSIFLMEALNNVYENEPRVTIDTSPRHYHYFSFGSCLVGTHHGHGTKLAQLPLIMAADQPELWGTTKHRYFWTGHVHHDQVKDFQGCKVESFRVLPPIDAYAAQKGYRSQRDMKSIILHREFGEVARNTVTPEMLTGISDTKTEEK